MHRLSAFPANVQSQGLEIIRVPFTVCLFFFPLKNLSLYMRGDLCVCMRMHLTVSLGRWIIKARQTLFTILLVVCGRQAVVRDERIVKIWVGRNFKRWSNPFVSHKARSYKSKLFLNGLFNFQMSDDSWTHLCHLPSYCGGFFNSEIENRSYN